MKLPFPVLTLFTLSNSAIAQSPFNFDEAISGDLSDNFQSPTLLTARLGSNILSGALSGGSNDLDFFEIVVPDGLEINAINVIAFTGGGNGSALLLAPGSTLPRPPAQITLNDVGFSLISSNSLGPFNTLPTLLTTGVPSISPFFGASTLTPGSYAGWLNETDPASTYTLEFVAVSTIPEPSSMAFLALAGLGLLKRRR